MDLDDLIARGRRGEAPWSAVLRGVIEAELFVPMAVVDGEQQPIVRDVDGVPHLSAFTTPERATTVGPVAQRVVRMPGRRVLLGIRPGIGLTVGTADGGAHLDPATVAQLQEGLRRHEGGAPADA